jgi:D-aminopeptidase
VDVLNRAYTVGALVQANHGERRHLLVGGRPVGRRIGFERVPSAWPLPNDEIVSAKPPADSGPESSSIIVLLATDAPLLPHQCRRLAQRATVGLARTGGFGLATSGDLFLAFSTGIHFAPGLGTPPPGELFRLEVLPEFSTDPLVIAAAEAVEEAILNAVVAAETMTGYQGHTAHALPHDLLVEAYKSFV